MAQWGADSTGDYGREPFSKLFFKNDRRSFADMNSLEGADDPEDTQQPENHCTNHNQI
jgi:hypothetical protein